MGRHLRICVGKRPRNCDAEVAVFIRKCDVVGELILECPALAVSKLRCEDAGDMLCCEDVGESIAIVVVSLISSGLEEDCGLR